ncbi:MAG: hypothetical protein HDR04_05350 [Lachnospiraceae bacterium]|nr:hypothetical protein [Lachnospiraceae bacterium]
MNRKKNLWGYILIAFVFLIYNIATIPFAKNIVFWTAYFFSVTAILMQVYTLYEMIKSQARIKGGVYDFPMVRISVLYLIVQITASLLLMGFSVKIPVFAAVLIEIIILAVAVMGFFAVKAARTEALRQDAELEKELIKMKELQARVNLLIVQCEEAQIQEILHKLAEEIHYSNPISKEITEEIEEEISVLFTEIEAAALDGNAESASGLCERITGLLRERDRICKYGK